ncbi:MAG: DHH family phosphoesterase, partial [candidate division KSB1 bacterium]|nr:DHH family phosphoesterase [candidate division KSB1 bacterium]
AIKAETQDLGREAKRADQKAYFTLYQLIDFQALAKIQRASVAPEYFQDMSRAIRRTAVFDDVVISTPGKVDSPDMIAEMADTFLRLQQVHWAVVIGFHGNHMFISVRTNQPECDAGQLVKKVVARLGTAGGHDMTAGGKIYCENNYKKQWLLKERVKKRFLAEFGFDRRRKGKKLLAMKSPESALIVDKNLKSRPA